MSTITETLWEIITDSDALHAELTTIMRQEYEPFLTQEKATCVNTSKLEHYVREQLIKWYEWLPETPASQRGRELAMEAFHGEDGRPPEETQHAVRLTAETVLRLIAQPEEQGRYHFEEMGMDHLACIPGLSRRLSRWASCL